MGINIPKEEDDKEEKIVKYSFDATNIVEVRETFVDFKGDNLPAVVVMFVVEGKLLAHTPALLVTYEEFKRKINEHNQKNSEVK